MQEHTADDRRPQIIIIAVTCFTIATVAVILLFISRRLAKVQYGWDDWSVVVALIRFKPVTAGGYLARLVKVDAAAVLTVTYTQLPPVTDQIWMSLYSSHRPKALYHCK